MKLRSADVINELLMGLKDNKWKKNRAWERGKGGKFSVNFCGSPVDIDGPLQRLTFTCFKPGKYFA